MVLWAGTTILYLTKEETETQSAPCPPLMSPAGKLGFQPALAHNHHSILEYLTAQWLEATKSG